MSGGVDSAVTAALIKSAGYDCVGATMKLYGKCFSEKDAKDAEQVAKSLGFSHSVFDLGNDFEKYVISNFVNTYIDGATPNPCIECNRYIKFRALLDIAKELGCDYIATGHYARVEKDGGRYLLKKGVDESKDQSYVLYSLTQEELSRTLLPLGGLTKAKVRSIATDMGFVSADKKESQDICFVPDGDYASFIERFSGKRFKKGNFVDKEGNVLGTHGGIIRYTIGQRKGLGLALPQPMYVCDKRTVDNTVVLATNEELFEKELTATDFNWIAPPSEKPFKATVKTRYRAQAANATVTPLENGDVKVVFDTPQRAITRGQAAVIYDNDTVIGGGKII